MHLISQELNETGTVLTPSDKWGNCGPEKLSNYSKVAQLLVRELESEPRQSGCRVHALDYYTTL